MDAMETGRPSVFQGNDPVTGERIIAVSAPLTFNGRVVGEHGALLMIDLDHFKSVNDTFGHATGDEVLAKVAQIMHTSFRRSDIAIRYGGDEFTAILPGAPISAAIDAAERVRSRVEKEIILPDGRPMTVSIGVGQMLPEEDIFEFLSRTDELLYRSKYLGRNRVSSI